MEMLRTAFFCMEKEEHRTACLPCVRELGARQVCCWVGSPACFPEGRLQAGAARRTAVFTDDGRIAGRCRELGILCIGYQPPGEEGDFLPVRLVWESFEDADVEELERWLCRFHHLPAIVARTARLVIRESTAEDFDAFWAMGEDAGDCFERAHRGSSLRACGLDGSGEEGAEGPDGRAKEEGAEGPDDDAKEEGAKDPDGRAKEEGAKGLDGRAKEEAREKFLAYIRHAYEFYGYGYWTVQAAPAGAGPHKKCPPGDCGVIGRCGLKDYDPGEKPEEGTVLLTKSPERDGSGENRAEEGLQLELGYGVATKFRGQGYAREMCEAALSYAFGTLGAAAVWVRISADNQASLALARRLGFAPALRGDARTYHPLRL